MRIVERLVSTYQSYGLLSFLRLVRDVLVSFLYTLSLRCAGFALFRQPFYVRGGHYMKFGRGFVSGVGLRLDAFPLAGCEPRLSIGDNVQVNDYVHIACCSSITIGNNVLIASKVFITDHNHGYYDDEHPELHEPPDVPPGERRITSGYEVVIEDNVWIGEHVSILPGVRIGSGAVIGAMSLINRDIPANSIAVGSPAKVIKRFNAETGRWEKCA